MGYATRQHFVLTYKCNKGYVIGLFILIIHLLLLVVHMQNALNCSSQNVYTYIHRLMALRFGSLAFLALLALLRLATLGRRSCN